MTGGARGVREEGGFTLIEVVVAAVLVVLSVGALADLFVNNSDSSLASQRQADLYSIAQQQIEKVHELVKANGGFNSLALNSCPTAGPATLPTTPTDPENFVTTDGESFRLAGNHALTSESAPAALPASEPLIGPSPCGNAAVAPVSGGAIAPLTTAAAASGSGSVSVWTFVTQTSVGCNSALSGSCSGDGRRVVVAVAYNDLTRRDVEGNVPLYMSTVITNPQPSNQPNLATGLRIGLNIS